MERIGAVSIGRRVASYRRDIGMTADELAKEVGPPLTGNAITKLERGHRAQIGPDLIVDIARALGVSPLALMFPLDDPDAEIVVNGVRGSVRSLGGWLLGDDTVTATFRQLVAADSAVGRAAEADRDAPAADALRLREALNKELSLRALLEAELRSLSERRPLREELNAPESVIGRLALGVDGRVTMTTEPMPEIEVPEGLNVETISTGDGEPHATR